MPLGFSFSFFQNPVMDSLATLIGKVALVLILIWLIFTIITVALFYLSVKKRKLYCPWLLRPAYLLLKGGVSTGCRMMGIDDTEIITILIGLENEVNHNDFAKVPISERSIFIPHCLRSAKCPAHLTPLGIKCLNCGKCGLGEVTTTLQNAGYKVFIIPGSTYIKRLLKRFQPKAMIGVGCLMEIKQFHELGRKIHMTALGVVMKTDGCLETTMDWDELYAAASIGLPEPIVPGGKEE